MHAKTNNLILVFLAILLSLIILVIILAINRGFDITDEGGFLLSYKNVEIYRGGIYNYHIIITKLTNWLNPGIIEYRWLTLIITMFSSLILAGGLYKWLDANYKKYNFYKTFLFIFGFISIGSLLFCFCSEITINNNVLTNLFLQLATGLILYLFSFDASKRIESKTNIILLGIVGFICGFSFFCQIFYWYSSVISIFLNIYFKFKRTKVKAHYHCSFNTRSWLRNWYSYLF